MTPQERARRLAEDLQTLQSGLERVQRELPDAAQSLSPQEIRAIEAVGRERCCPMSAIARAIRLSLSSCTGLVDRLFEKRLVRRDRSPDDRRVVHVELTDEGRQLREAAAAARAAFARDLLGGLSPDEQEALVTLLGKTAEKLKERPAA